MKRSNHEAPYWRPLDPRLCFCATLSHAADEWRPADTGRQVAFTALVAGDYFMTKKWIDEGGHEMNPLLRIHGDDPTGRTLFIVGALASTVHARVSYLLPTSYKFHIGDERFDWDLRAGWQYLGISLQVGTIGWDYSLWVRVPFK